MFALPSSHYLPSSSGGGVDKAVVKARVFEVLGRHPKISAAKLSPSATWAQLGLDSLDSVEVIMAMEEEFVVEMPDEQVSSLHSFLRFLYLLNL
jgi:NADH dehydrogenase (ubiquinone) 1 alpha/beta subcomplex 1